MKLQKDDFWTYGFGRQDQIGLIWESIGYFKNTVARQLYYTNNRIPIGYETHYTYTKFNI